MFRDVFRRLHKEPKDCPGTRKDRGPGHKSLTVIRVRKCPGGDGRLAGEEEINAL